MLELYKDLVIDHALNPRNKYILKNFNHHAKGYNSFCGDTICLYLYVENQIINNISFDGAGCSISIASASIATCILKDKNIEDVHNICKYFQKLLQSNKMSQDKEYNELNIL